MTHHPAADLPIVERARAHGARTAVVAPEGAFTYAQLLDASARVAAALLDGAADLAEARVAFLAPPGWDYVAVQWGIWRAGGIAVPLAVSHPPAELAYVIRDADAAVVVAHPEFVEVLRPLADADGRRFITTADALGAEAGPLPVVDEARRAMIVYTSGTTGRPKGAVTTHATLRAQVTSLVRAWEWTADDRTLLVLPLHHVHGIVNVLACALWAGAECGILPRFDADETWRVIERGRLTLFMAVPTVYARLIAAYDAAEPERRARMGAGCRAMRLMVSGSAALPVRTLERWREISGHVLLERYGMTEIGMALGNPLHGERRPGFVGRPFPGMDVRLVDDDGALVQPGTPGEVEVRGPNVFLEYWRRSEPTAEAFRDGWFRTGDVGVVEDGYWRLLGRRSVDILKTGGFKVSALEIKEVLRTHPAVAECAVVGVPDEAWGERVCAAVETAPGAVLSLEALRAWAREHLAPYKLPRALCIVDALPRNAMGKVVKPEVAKLFPSSEEAQ
ncbi:acyl-CoA synthetase [Longimicrobium sp.]|uniref:acyl-CoA synthetase n=1 Tax=Longimicrobium sp. TaxID=2029185 RepID=UPI002E363D30|nr:acyl-CoA synthetase [Longimicrobium sp.]HEX6037310.1 acyl-CoA synthetase [Longimicrobium sp.]